MGVKKIRAQRWLRFYSGFRDKIPGYRKTSSPYCSETCSVDQFCDFYFSKIKDRRLGFIFIKLMATWFTLFSGVRWRRRGRMMGKSSAIFEAIKTRGRPERVKNRYRVYTERKYFHCQQAEIKINRQFKFFRERHRLIGHNLATVWDAKNMIKIIRNSFSKSIPI